MIFPQVEFDCMTWFLLQNYVQVDDINGVTAADPTQVLTSRSIN